MVFATRVSHGEAGPQGCPGLEPEALEGLQEYLGKFQERAKN
jgi:hypothetical protein